MRILEKSHHHILQLLIVVALLLTQLCAQAYADDFGDIVVKRGMVDDDIYLAGRQVDLYATVDGDAVVAGGQLNLEGDIGADVIAAGGSIQLRGAVADDARLAGGEIRVTSRIGDDLVAAGGRIHLSPSAAVGGRAWLSSGELRVDGHVMDELRASSGRIVISGTLDGDAELWGDEIIIEETAVINGNLHYRSAREASIAPGARIEGKVVHTPVDVDIRPVIASVIFAGLMLLLSLVVTAVLLYLLFPELFQRVSQSLRSEPWLSLAIGLAVFAGAPLLMVILFSTAVGVWLALMLLAIYLVTLLAGYFIGAMFVANAGLNLFHRADAGKALHAVALALAIITLGVFNLVPLLGGLVNWAVLLAGVGATSRRVYLAYRA